LALIVGTLGAIFFSVRFTRPIFANKPTVAAALTQRVPAAAAVLEPAPAVPPVDTSAIGRLTSTPQFETDRKAFAADLVRTGRMSQARADSIAFYAVREAYLRGIPPAVIFGVMLTENAQFVSRAMSNVGAVGLMQVYPKVWLKALSQKFGKDLAADSTNLKYGVFILSTYVKSSLGQVKPQDVTKGLLRYNGCVHGTNTPNCRTYPSKVQRYVENQGESLCGDKSFYDCIAKPFVAGLMGKPEETQ
jgi:soluble lytic murein transglycosylase-like protein